MRKQTKIVALAAVLALGASFTSMAATYDWRLEDDGWYCYNEDGEAYDDEWVMSYGKEYFVDEDGKMVTSSRVDDLYYVGSDGTKTVSDWRFTFAEDEEDEEDAEEAWFYFNAKGEMQKEKRVSWNGDYYYLDEEGKMLTGWVYYDKGVDVREAAKDDVADSIDKLVYCEEDGSRAANMWLLDYEIGSDAEEEDLDEDDMVYYWIESDGAAATGKKSSINGETYFFGEDAIMLYGWVVTTDDGETYVQAEDALGEYENASVYFCGNDDQGWAKKNKWIKVANSEEFWKADEDTTTYWFYIKSTGKVFIPTASDSNAITVTKVTFKNGENGTFVDGSASNAEFKEINDETYLFDFNGQMLKGLYKVDGEMNYFGTSNEGQRKTGSYMVEDSFEDEYELTFAKKDSKVDGEYSKYAALNGNVGGYLYKNGQLQKSEEKGLYKFVTVDGAEYLVNYKGKVQTDLDDEYELENGTEFKFSANAKLNTTDNSVKEGAITAK